MRLSVMELGRFTLKGGSGGQPATKLIILHVGGERNAGFVGQRACSISQWKNDFKREKSYHHRGHRGTQRKIRGLCASWFECYFGLGAILSVLAALFGCFAMIMSLILS